MSVKWTDREIALISHLHPPKATLKQIKSIFDSLGYDRSYAAIEKQSQRCGPDSSVKLTEEESEAIDDVLIPGFAFEEKRFEGTRRTNEIETLAKSFQAKSAQIDIDKNLFRHSQQTKEFVLDAGSSKEIELIPVGDIHVGNHQCNEEYLAKVIEYIKNKKNCYWFGMGDLLESIPANYKIPTWGQKLTPEEQFRRTLDLFAPISHKALWLIEGNHEERITRSTSISLSRLMADIFETHYHEAPNYLKVTVKSKHGEQDYLFVASHGQGASLSNDKEFECLRNMLPGADVYLLGHDHRLKAFPGVHYVQNGIKKFFCIRTGCTLNYPLYALKKLFAPTPVGLAKIILSSKTHSIAPDITGEF